MDLEALNSTKELKEIWTDALKRYQDAAGLDLTSGKDREIEKLPNSVDDLFARLDDAKSKYEEYRKRGEPIRKVLQPTLAVLQRMIEIVGGAQNGVGHTSRGFDHLLIVFRSFRKVPTYSGRFLLRSAYVRCYLSPVLYRLTCTSDIRQPRTSVERTRL
jgi:hypothetical protein